MIRGLLFVREFAFKVFDIPVVGEVAEGWAVIIRKLVVDDTAAGVSGLPRMNE